MRRISLYSALLLVLFVMVAGAAAPSVHAAPGDFLYRWGSQYYFESPFGVARDQSGNIYVTDFSVANVQVFDVSGKLLRKWGTYGSGDGQFENPAAIAVAPDGTVYVTDDVHGGQIFNSAGDFIGTFGGPGSGHELSWANGLCLDSAGNIYAADTMNDRIQVFDSTGRFLRAWGRPGTGTGEFNRPVGIAVVGGTLYVTDSGNYRIQVFDTDGHFLRTWSVGDFYRGLQPIALAVSGSGDLYVTTSDPGGSIEVYDSLGTPLRKIGDGLGSLRGLTVHPNGNIYVADQYPVGIAILTTSGTPVGTWATKGSKPGEFDVPKYAALDSSGNVYVTDMNNSRVQVFTSTGNFIREWGSSGTGAGQFGSPVGIAVDSAGNVYVGDGADIQYSSYKMQVFDSNGNFMRGWNGALGSPEGMTIDGNGYLYVADFKQRNVQVYDSTGTLIRQWKSTIDPEEAPSAVAVDAKGNAYVTFCNPYGRVEMFDNDGNYLRQIGEGLMSCPTGIAIDPGGNIFVTSQVQNHVFVFNPDGTPRATWGGTGHDNGLFYFPIGIVTDKSGTRVYVVDSGNNRIQVLEGFGSQLPAGWFTRDIGSVGVAGRASFASGTFTLSGSGADIWGTADGFRYAYQTLTGDGEIVARVASLQNTNGYAKAGVMIREALTANSKHAMVDITPGHGAEFSRRGSTGGSTGVTGLGGVAAPYWVKLVRSGNTFSAYVSSDGNSWRSLGSDVITMASSVYIGLVDCSHVNTVLNTAAIDNVSVGIPQTPPTVAITSPADGAVYGAPASISITATAAGGPGASVKQVEFFAQGTLIGTAATSPYTVVWSGVPAGDYTLTAKVTDTSGATATSAPVKITVQSTPLPSPWLTSDVGAVGLAGSATYSNGVFTIKGAGADIWGSADSFRFVYQTLAGDGQIVARVASLANTNGYAKAALMFRQSLDAGSVHAMMDLTPTYGAEFSRRTAAGGSTTVTGLGGVAAPYWLKLVRSGNTFSGYVAASGGTWRLVGTSTVPMGSSVLGGLAVCSHNTQLLTTSALDNVSVTPGSTVLPTATITSPASGSTFSAPATIPITASATAGTGASVKQVEFFAGSTLIGTATASPYGVTWSDVPQGSYSLTAVVTDTLGNKGTSPAVLVTVSSLPGGWSTQDVGSVGIAGSAVFAGGVFTLKGSGADIWSTADAFRFVYKPMTGDGQIIARVSSLTNTHGYAKGGVMIRETLAAGSKHAMVDLTPGYGAEFSRRTSTSGSTDVTGRGGVAAPYWVRLVRSGNTFSGYISTNGSTWALVGTSTITMNSTVYVGLIITSHTNYQLGTTTIDGVQ